MAIYTRNKEGKLKALPIKAIKGENGIDGIDGVTPNIKIGEVTTLEAGEKAKVEIVGERENPVINFSIPKGKDGDVDGVEIKDGEISEEDTWSSDKITKWSMEQDGVHWVDKEDNFIRVDNTYEYKLKEVEIFGDTWQDSDSKNLFDKDNINLITESINDPRSYVVEDNTVKFEIPSSYNQVHIMMKLDRDLDPSKMYHVTYSSYRAFIDGEWVSSDVHKYMSKAKEGNIFIMAFQKEWKPITKFEITDLQISEENVPYEPYHKADLSNIQHAGELYLDEDGEPKLDDQGRKQYKFEIETVNKNLVKPNMEMINYIYNNGEFVNGGAGGRCTKEFIRVNSGGRYSYKYTSTVNPTWLRVICFDDEYKYLGCPLGLISGSSKNGTFVMPENTKFIRIQHLNGDNISTSDLIIIKSDTVITENIQHKSHKETILLPCQLMKVRDYKDRLYWDESRGKYIVESKVAKIIYPDYQNNWMDFSIDEYEVCIASNGGTFNDTIGKHIMYGIWNTMRHVISCDVIYNPKTGSHIYLYMKKEMLIKNDYEFSYEGARKYLIDNNATLYLPLQTPELIETNITKPLYLPTYNNKTHAYITNTNNAKATIKAKFPLKTSNTLSTLSFESNKTSNDILNLQDINVELVSNNFEMDFRVSEIEWNLEDRGLLTLHELLTNENISNNKINLTRYEQAKILIISNKYNKDKMTYQLSKYLERNYIKQEEFDELVELMK